MFKKFAWVESITSLLIFVNVILIIQSYVKNLKSNAKIASSLQSLHALQNGFVMYYQGFETYPANQQIYDDATLKNTLSPYLQDLEKISFYFLSYQEGIDNYTLLVKTEDKVFQITEDSIKEIGAAP